MKKLLSILVLGSIALLQAADPVSESTSSGFGRWGKWRNATPEQRAEWKAKRAEKLKGLGVSDESIAALQEIRAERRAERENLSDEERSAKWKARKEKWQNATPEERAQFKTEIKAKIVDKLKAKGVTDEEIAILVEHFGCPLRHARKRIANLAGTQEGLMNINLDSDDEDND